MADPHLAGGDRYRHALANKAPPDESVQDTLACSVDRCIEQDALVLAGHRRLETLGRIRTCHQMSYSPSTFTVEINGVPAVVLQAKWHSEADELCRAWVNRHLTTKGQHAELELPPIVKLRLAHADEKEAYDLGSDGAEYDGHAMIVYLIDLASPPWAEGGP